MANLDRILELAGLKESDYSAHKLAGKSLTELQETKADLESQIKGCVVLTEHVEDLKFKLLNVEKALKESLEDQLDEKAPADQEEFVKSAKSDFKKRYGKRWKEVLYATANARHNNEATEDSYLEFADKLFESMEKEFPDYVKPENLLFDYPKNNTDGTHVKAYLLPNGEGPSVHAMLLFFKENNHIDTKVVYKANSVQDAKDFVATGKMPNSVSESVKSAEQMQNLQPSSALEKDEVGNVFDGHDEEKENAQELHNDAMGITQDEETKVEVPADVFTQIDRRISELKQSIELYDKTTFQTHYSNKLKAIENLEFIREKLKLGTMEGYKQAQIHFGTIASIYAGNLFPAKLVDFLHDGQADEKKEVAYGDYMKGDPDKKTENQVPHNALYKTLNTSIYPQKGEDNVPKKD